MMKIKIICLGDKLPNWANQASDDYLKRFHHKLFDIQLTQVALIKRNKSISIHEAIDKESEKVLKLIPNGYLNIALDRTGKQQTSEMLAEKLENWQQQSQDIVLCIGGPEGFSKKHLNNCDQIWSLSELTFAHSIARVVLLEQLYRAYSISIGHPYHRGSQAT